MNLEHRLRQRIDRLSDERDAERDLVHQLLEQTRQRPKFRRCAYCGTPGYGYACGLHRDLVQREAG